MTYINFQMDIIREQFVFYSDFFCSLKTDLTKYSNPYRKINLNE